MKIAYICNFSYPVKEGVWNNVYNTAKYMLSKGHEVFVFSSNLNPSSGKLSSGYEEYEGVKIYRFPVKFKIGSYGLFWNFSDKLLKIRPDIIHTHVYRNPHSHTALKIAKKLSVPCILTTHAPFVERELRTAVANFFVWFYDTFYGKKDLNSYSKVLAITKWEMPYLLEIGCRKNNIEYVPNGVPELLFSVNINNKKRNRVIYLGRISEIKNLQLIVDAAKKLPDIAFKIIGPIEKGYSIKSESKNLQIVDRVFNRAEQKKYLSEADIFLLTSKREGFPQALIEAMAAGKIVISSDILGAKEVIENGKNGFIFSDINDLADRIKYCLSNFDRMTKIRKNARKTALKFRLKEINEKIYKIYKEVKK